LFARSNEVAGRLQRERNCVARLRVQGRLGETDARVRHYSPMDDIHLEPYDPRWPAMFAEEAARLRQVLRDEPLAGLEHFGSTAIAGLAAKPIIDILIAVPSLPSARTRFPEKLKALDYVFWAENPNPDRLFFVKGMPPFGAKRTHHVHVTEPAGDLWQRLVFRDYLRQHPQEAARYEALKRELAAKHPTDREAYTAAKSDYVDSVMRKAAAP
jgi:GrpB-like predicted nucleotidyltransferase (UPF0157 family)